ncbi:ATP-binding protein [Glutamicibacter arilaitensis]|uniref:ATP-binding protein n=1 Tax=Glutamicibacter arilaitensis TaxID=256701 RepID=UPI0038508FAA
MNLRPTHHGYAYQDIVTGNAFVDLLLGAAVSIKVDLKDFNGDRFDDTTIAYTDGRRVRFQIKHTTIDRELSQATFTADKRHLRLDLILRSLLSDLDSNPDTTYRVVVRDGQPDANLAGVLETVDPSEDPGDPLPGINTRRYKFSPDKLKQLTQWNNLLSSLTDQEVRRGCGRLIIDTDAPTASLSFHEPGPAEAALIQRVAVELGAGRPPNINRSPEEIALTLVHAATKARATNGNITRASIAPEVRLTTDFGAVRDGSPTEPVFAVEREGAVATLKSQIDSVAQRGGRVVLVGEPGAGKSWLSQQIADNYHASDWIVARHHCWLGETDTDRNQRVLGDVVIGSLLKQLEIKAPEAIAGVRPRFAATAETLAKALLACRSKHQGKQILLIVDGLDHIDRVRGRNIGGGIADPARAMVEQLASIDLPEGTCLLLASQPGMHLDGARPASGMPLQVPRMSTDELATLAARHGVLKDTKTGLPITVSNRQTIVSLLAERSHGNALYATYLCRHAIGASLLGQPLSAPVTVAEAIERLQQVPDTANDIDTYYQHLLNGLTDGELQAIGALAICDFALTKEELGQVIPAFALGLEEALATLAPVLVSLPGAGGLKVHHESLSRFIRRGKPEAWSNHIRKCAAAWLRSRGFFNDTRSFRNLPQLLADLGQHEELVALIDRDFVSNAIAQLQPPEAIKHVLATVATEAQNRRDWKTLITCVEAIRAVSVYENESLPDTLVQYADVVVRLISADTVAERLIYESRATFPARWGLNLCEAVDRAGAPAPWDAYLSARIQEAKNDNVSYGAESDANLHLSEQLGHLRQRFDAGRTIDKTELAKHFDGHDAKPHLGQLVEVFACAVPAEDLLDTAREMTVEKNAATVLITLAELAATGSFNLPDATEIAREAATRAPEAYINEYLDHGIPASELVALLALSDLQSELRNATKKLLSDLMTERPEHVRRWLNLLRIAHETDPNIVLIIGSDISGPGFYRAWLRFAVATVGLDEDSSNGATTPDTASTAVRVALEQLAIEAEPFTGRPRAVDLWSIRHLIHEVIERALAVVLPHDLGEVLAFLTTIGDKTTASLMGMAEGGPLATNDLLAILSRLADRMGIEPIHKLMSEVRHNRYDANTMYSVTADFEMATARICLDAGDQLEAQACWGRAAALLCAYDGHKDPTIYEFIEATADIGAIDLDSARAALARVQDAAYLAADHSDGRGTNHAPATWWRRAAELDPIAAALNSANTLIRDYGYEDFHVHTTHIQLLETYAESADPIVLAALRLTTGPEWRQQDTDLVLLKRLQAEVGLSVQSDRALVIFANQVAASYDNQALVYVSDLPTSTAPLELVAAVQALGGPDFPLYEPREENNLSETPLSSPHRGSESLLEILEKSQRPTFGSGAQGAALAARDYQDKRYQADQKTIRFDRDALISAIGWRILEATSIDGAQGGMKVLDAVTRELHFTSVDELLAVIVEGLARCCDGTIPELDQVASYAHVVAYTRIRGGGGWQTFAGRERIELWKQARVLDADTADDTLAAAIGYNVATEGYGVFGITEAVVAAFAAAPAQGTAGTADQIWNTAFDILEQRLPGTVNRTGPRYTPTLAPDPHGELDSALASLAIATICQPKTEDIRTALLALTLLIACRPQLAQFAVIPVIEANLDAGRITWVLETVHDHLRYGNLTDDLKDKLTALATTNRLSVRTLAGQILAQHGYPVPNVPATHPDGSIRRAINQSMDDS